MTEKCYIQIKTIDVSCHLSSGNYLTNVHPVWWHDSTFLPLLQVDCQPQWDGHWKTSAKWTQITLKSI